MNRFIKSKIALAFAFGFGGLQFLLPLIMAQEKGGGLAGDVKIGFRMDSKNQLFLDIINLSDSDKSVTSNIEGIVNLKFQNFPKGWTLQFRSAKNVILKLKDQGNDGWMDPFLYSSNLVTDERMNEADVMRAVSIPPKSTLPYPIEYTGVFRLIASDMPATSPKVHEFRVRCNIKLIESGKVVQTEVLSEWYPCKAVMKQINQK